MSIFNIFEKLNAQKQKPAGKPEYIIAGLGNTGLQYENTRHNAGFMAADYLAEKYNKNIKRFRFKSYTEPVIISGVCCLLMKPATYMNKSGEAVVMAADYYKIQMDKVIICYDDISLEPSFIRIRRKGSDGGHNGIKSIIELTGEDVFPRVKIGIGKKPHPDYNLADWVLSRFTEYEINKMNEGCEKTALAIELILQGKIDEAMNKYN